MASAPGKRKRKGTETVTKARLISEDSSQSLSEDAQAIFKRHFEAHFKPLPSAGKTVKALQYEHDLEDEDYTEWEGISEAEEGVQIEVIEHTELQSRPVMSKEELKAFMSSKPPTSTLRPKPSSKSSTRPDDEDLTESANLKKDLALQRLLAESHLLDSSASSPSLLGSNRHRATDLRLQTLGAKSSISRQEKMPMSHRRGITAKQNEREERRRREARENGVILEKAKVGTKLRREVKRERNIGGPGVGKFSGGTLKLSKRDVYDIEGPTRKISGKGGRGGAPRGRGGKRGSSRGSLGSTLAI